MVLRHREAQAITYGTSSICLLSARLLPVADSTRSWLLLLGLLREDIEQSFWVGMFVCAFL